MGLHHLDTALEMVKFNHFNHSEPYLAQHTVTWVALLNRVMNTCVPKVAGNFLNADLVSDSKNEICYNGF